MKIVLSVVVTALLFVGCSDDKTTKTQTTVKQEVKQETQKAVEKVESVVKDDIQEVEKVVQKEVDKNEPQKIVQKPKKVEEVAETKVEVVPEKIAVVAEKESVLDGSKIFAKCSACHGKQAEKKALNKSQIIAGWESSKLIDALNGYKAGTYGSSMKGVMKSQVSSLSDAEVKAVAEYISTL